MPLAKRWSHHCWRASACLAGERDAGALAIASATDRHLGGRVLATELRDYGAVGPHDFAGGARVRFAPEVAIIGGSAHAVDPAFPDARCWRYCPRYSDCGPLHPMATGVTMNVYGHLFSGAQAQLTEDFGWTPRAEPAC